jgi:hypothetical protein
VFVRPKPTVALRQFDYRLQLSEVYAWLAIISLVIRRLTAGPEINTQIKREERELWVV